MDYELIASSAQDEDKERIFMILADELDDDDRIKLLDDLLVKAGSSVVNKYSDLQRRRVSARFYSKLTKELTEHKAQVVNDLTIDGFYVHEITVIKGLNVEFKTLLDDENHEVFEYLSDLSDLTDVQTNRAWGRRVLSHAICKINGELVGGVGISNYQELSLGSSKPDAIKALTAVADKRMQHIGAMNSGIVDKLLEVNGAFSAVVSAIINDGDVIDEIKK